MATVKTETQVPLKVPPQALDIERTVLGSMLIDINALDTAMGILTEECFYSTAHRNIFICMRDMSKHMIDVDIMTLTEELRKREWLEAVGSEAYLSELVEQVATSANIESHCNILQSKATLRELITTAADISTSCFSPEADDKKVLDRAEQKIFQIADAKVKGRPVQLRDLLSTTFEDIEKYGKEGGMTGVRTGFDKLDEMTTGFHPSDLVIIAARPGMGKTALSLSIALNTTTRAQRPTPTVIFSLEMSRAQLVQRMLCAEAEIDIHDRAVPTILSDRGLLLDGGGETLGGFIQVRLRNRGRVWSNTELATVPNGVDNDKAMVVDGQVCSLGHTTMGGVVLNCDVYACSIDAHGPDDNGEFGLDLLPHGAGKVQNGSIYLRDGWSYDKLADLFERTLKLPEVGGKSEDFRRWTAESAEWSRRLRAHLGTLTAGDPAAISRANAAYQEVRKRCTDCHRRYRDE